MNMINTPTYKINSHDNEISPNNTMCEAVADYHNNKSLDDLKGMPIVVTAQCMYILLEDCPDLYSAIQTPEAFVEYNLFTDEEHNRLREQLRKTGCTVRKEHHTLEFMEKEIDVTCLAVKFGEHYRKLHIIPWFLIPKRPYPSFVYLQASDLFNGNLELGYLRVRNIIAEKFGIPGFSVSVLRRLVQSSSLIKNSQTIELPDMNEPVTKANIVEAIMLCKANIENIINVQKEIEASREPSSVTTTTYKTSAPESTKRKLKTKDRYNQQELEGIMAKFQPIVINMAKYYHRFIF